MMYHPLLHGSNIDEILFAVAAILSLLLFIAMALFDKKREIDKEDEKEKHD